MSVRRTVTIILALIISLCLSSCGALDFIGGMFNNSVSSGSEGLTDDNNVYMKVVPDSLIYSSYEPVVSDYSYNALPLDSERAMYDKLLEAYYDISPDREETTGRYPMPQINLKGYPMTEAQVRTAVKAVADDHPEIFWPTGTMGFYADESTTIVQVYSRYSPEEVDSRVNAVRQAANEFYASVPDNLSEYDRELLVHDFILERTEYDSDVDTVDFDSNNPDIYTAYGALVNRKAVCEGYARAFQMLMNGLGVDCVGVIGSSRDQMHIWNAVKLSGGWYNVDATWDDQEEIYARYIYFNIDDDMLLENHTYAPMYSDMTDDEINGESGDYNASVMNIFIPGCYDRTMSYYCRSTPHLTDYDGAEVKSALRTAAEAQEEYFIFYIDESFDFEDTVYELFAYYPQYFFSYVRDINSYLPDYSVDNSNIAYYSLEKCRAVAVELNYY